MPKERKKVLCMDAQRHAEYYGMQRTFDELYAKSKAGETFIGLMELVLSPDNIEPLPVKRTVKKYKIFPTSSA